MIAEESRGIIAKINSGTIVPVSKAIAAINNETDPVRLASVAMALDAAKKMDRKIVERRDYYGELAIFTGKRLGELIIAGQQAGLIETRGGDRKSKGHGVALIPLTDIVPTNKYAARCYRLNEIDDETIKGYVAQCKSEGSEITKAGVQRFAKKAEDLDCDDDGDDEFNCLDEMQKVIEACRTMADRWPEEYRKSLGQKLMSIGKRIVEYGVV